MRNNRCQLAEADPRLRPVFLKHFNLELRHQALRLKNKSAGCIHSDGSGKLFRRGRDSDFSHVVHLPILTLEAKQQVDIQRTRHVRAINHVAGAKLQALAAPATKVLTFCCYRRQTGDEKDSTATTDD